MAVHMHNESNKEKNRKQKEYIVQMYTGGGGDLHVPANPPPPM